MSQRTMIGYSGKLDTKKKFVKSLDTPENCQRFLSLLLNFRETEISMPATEFSEAAPTRTEGALGSNGLGLLSKQSFFRIGRAQLCRSVQTNSTSCLQRSN